MNLKIKNKDFFVKYFLQPISKISDTCCLSVQGGGIGCVVSSADNAIILNISHKLEDQACEGEEVLNVPDIKKLIRALDVVEEESVELKIDKNNLSYKNKSVSFKYHLLENGVVNKPKINVEKINSIKVDTTFYLPEKAFTDIIKASTFCVDTNKIYLYTQEGKIFAELTDKTRPNVDSFGVEVSDTYSGKEINFLCLNLEVLRIISTNRVKQVTTKINTDLGVVLFEYGNNILSTQFIVSSLTK